VFFQPLCRPLGELDGVAAVLMENVDDVGLHLEGEYRRWQCRFRGPES
jgi:hypothetical protein